MKLSLDIYGSCRTGDKNFGLSEMGKVNKSSHVTEIHKIPECGGYLMYILVLVYTNLDENLLPVYNYFIIDELN